MGCSWNEGRFEDYKTHLHAKKHHLNAWELIELIDMGNFTKGINPQTVSMGINEVYQELVMDVIKQVNFIDLLLTFYDSQIFKTLTSNTGFKVRMNGSCNHLFFLVL